MKRSLDVDTPVEPHDALGQGPAPLMGVRPVDEIPVDQDIPIATASGTVGVEVNPGAHDAAIAATGRSFAFHNDAHRFLRQRRINRFSPKTEWTRMRVHRVPIQDQRKPMPNYRPTAHGLFQETAEMLQKNWFNPTLDVTLSVPRGVDRRRIEEITSVASPEDLTWFLRRQALFRPRTKLLLSMLVEKAKKFLDDSDLRHHTQREIYFGTLHSVAAAYMPVERELEVLNWMTAAKKDYNQFISPDDASS